MYRRYFSLLLLIILNLLSVAAAPQQAEGSLEIPWWVWLIVISVFLLIAFVVFISLDWREANGRDENDDRHR
jgi:heme/copper-type cytochrome/quinol oxidase subunit 2